MIEEVWKDIEGYEGLYQVSNLGRVRSLDRMTYSREGWHRAVKGKMLKPLFNRGGGHKGQIKGRYAYVNLTRNHKYKSVFIHRLVLETFVVNPDPSIYTQCNHKDENTYNNRVDNLEWCTPIENINHGTRNERANKPLRKPVNMYSKDGVFLNSFESTKDAERKTGVHSGSISCCCRNLPKFHTAGGYVWKYA